jgi:hypothetical protein
MSVKEFIGDVGDRFLPALHCGICGLPVDFFGFEKDPLAMIGICTKHDPAALTFIPKIGRRRRVVFLLADAPKGGWEH